MVFYFSGTGNSRFVAERIAGVIGQEAIDVLKQGKINCIVECTPKLGKLLMETALKLKNGESVMDTIHPEEQVFSDEMDTSQIAPRGY